MHGNVEQLQNKIIKHDNNSRLRVSRCELVFNTSNKIAEYLRT